MRSINFNKKKKSFIYFVGIEKEKEKEREYISLLLSIMIIIKQHNIYIKNYQYIDNLVFLITFAVNIIKLMIRN